MRGYLKTLGWLFKLQPSTTTVGRHTDSDLCLQNGGVEDKHAVIELNPQDRCFVLRDLNSAYGTYVNNCHIHNAAVRLSTGDQLHFGYGGPTFELCVDSTPQVPCPPVQQRVAWHTPMQVMDEPKPSRSQSASSSQLPFLQKPAPAQVSRSKAPATAPRPPSKTRPASAGVRRGGLGQATDHEAVSVKPGGEQPSTHTEMSASSQTLQLLLQEKEERLLRLGNEVERLAVFESESRRKDAVIAGLRDELFVHRHQAMQSEPEINLRLRGLEKDIGTKKEQIQQLGKQMMELQKSSGAVLQQSVVERDLKISSLRGQVEKLKRDNNTSAGLVSTLQRDLSAREKQTLTLAAEVDRLRQDLHQKDVQLGAGKHKMRENSKLQGVLAERDKHLALLQKRVEELEQSRAVAQTSLVQKGLERDSLKAMLDRELQDKASLKSELDQTRRQQQGTSARLKQEQTRLESLRKEVIQVISTSSGGSSSQVTLTDQQLIEQVEDTIRELEDLRNRLKEMEDQLEESAMEQKRSAEEEAVLRSALKEVQAHLQEAYSEPTLQRKLLALQEQYAPAALSWVHDAVLSLLACQLAQVQQASQALLDAGIDVSDITEGVPGGIRALGQQLQGCKVELGDLQAVLTSSQEAHAQSMQEQSKEFQERMGVLRDELEQEGQQRLEDAVMAERDRITQSLSEEMSHLRSQNAGLTQSLEERQQEEAGLNQQLEEARRELESVRGAEAALCEQARLCQTQRDVDLAHAAQKGAELERERWREHEAEYREQVRQHARTIVDMELRLKTRETERDALCARLTDAEERLEHSKASCARRVTERDPEVLALEENVTALRAALADARKDSEGQGEVIAALSRDLAIANARMSDVAGELSEQQKVELERHRAMVVEQRVQLSTLTQKLSHMSQLVEQKGAELQRTREELRHFQEAQWECTSAESSGDSQLQHPVNREGDHSLAGTRSQSRAHSHIQTQGSKSRGRRQKVIQPQTEGPTKVRFRVPEQGLPLASSPKWYDQQGALLTQQWNELNGQKVDEGDNKHGDLVPKIPSQEIPEQKEKVDLSDTLDLSERTYLDLVRALSDALELGEERLSGSASLKHTTQDEREKLGSCRRRDLELLCEQARCREEQLQEYQKEQEALRQSQVEAQRLQGRVDSLREELQAERQERSLLQEALRRTQDRLEQEVGRSRAVKECKATAADRPVRKNGMVVPHSCVQGEKAKPRKANLQEKLKKKEYEVELLKEQLKKWEREVSTETL